MAAEAALAVLLVGKGQLTGDAASMAEAEPHLLRAERGIPVSDPQWAPLIRALAVATSALAVAGFPGHVDRAVRLLRAAAKHTADPEQAAMIDQTLGAVLFTRKAGQRGPDADEGIKRLTEAFEKAPAGSPVRAQIAYNLCSALAGRYFMSGSRQDLRAARHYLSKFDEDGAGGVPAALIQETPDAELMVAATRGQIEVARGMADADPAAFRAGVASLRAAVRLAGPGHPLTGRLRSDLGLALLLCFDHDRNSHADLRDAISELEAAVNLLATGHFMRDMTLFRLAAGLVLLGISSRDAGTLREGAARLRQIRATWTDRTGDPLRVTAMLAVAHAELHRMSGDAADVAAARDWYATAAAEFERQPGHPQHGSVLIGLARLEHRVGARQAAIRAGLAALRVRARDVLLQAGPAHGLATARIAATEAVEVAGWCLADEAAALAVEALELGRGLVLHAATSTADLPELLDAAGRGGLADEWRQLAEDEVDEPWDTDGAAGTLSSLLADESLAVPSDLRERTLAALEDEALVTPPGYGEIAAALHRNGSDVLAYLLPPSSGRPGQALLVTADGSEPRSVPLRELTAETSSPLDEFAAAQDRMLVAPGVSGADGGLPRTGDGQTSPDSLAALFQWADKLGKLCDWAWTTVIEPLLAEIPRVAPGAPPRLVLVPVGRPAWSPGMPPAAPPKEPAGGTPSRTPSSPTRPPDASSPR